MENKLPSVILTDGYETAMEVDESFVDSLEVQPGEEQANILNKTEPESMDISMHTENQPELAARILVDDVLHTATTTFNLNLSYCDGETSLSHIEAPIFVPSPDISLSPNRKTVGDDVDEDLTPKINEPENKTSFEELKDHDVLIPNDDIQVLTDFNPSIPSLSSKGINLGDDVDKEVSMSNIDKLQNKTLFEPCQTPEVSTSNDCKNLGEEVKQLELTPKVEELQNKNLLEPLPNDKIKVVSILNETQMNSCPIVPSLPSALPPNGKNLCDNVNEEVSTPKIDEPQSKTLYEAVTDPEMSKVGNEFIPSPIDDSSPISENLNNVIGNIEVVLAQNIDKPQNKENFETLKRHDTSTSHVPTLNTIQTDLNKIIPNSISNLLENCKNLDDDGNEVLTPKIEEPQNNILFEPFKGHEVPKPNDDFIPSSVNDLFFDENDKNLGIKVEVSASKFDEPQIKIESMPNNEMNVVPRLSKIETDFSSVVPSPTNILFLNESKLGDNVVKEVLMPKVDEIQDKSIEISTPIDKFIPSLGIGLSLNDENLGDKVEEVLVPKIEEPLFDVFKSNEIVAAKTDFISIIPSSPKTLSQMGRNLGDNVVEDVLKMPVIDKPQDKSALATFTGHELVTGKDGLDLKDKNLGVDIEEILVPKIDEPLKGHALSMTNDETKVAPRLSMIQTDCSLFTSEVKKVQNAVDNSVSTPLSNKTVPRLSESINIDHHNITDVISKHNNLNVKTNPSNAVTIVPSKPSVVLNDCVVESVEPAVISNDLITDEGQVLKSNEPPDVCNTQKLLKPEELLDWEWTTTKPKQPVVPVHQQQKRQSTGLVIINPNVSEPEDRSPLRKLSGNKRQQQQHQQQEVSEENKENTPIAPKFDLSFFSDSPSRPRRSGARNSILQLFDPLYKSFLDSTSNEPSVQRNSSVINEDQRQPQSVGLHAEILNQLKESLAYEGELEDFVITVLKIRSTMEDAVEDRMSLDQEVNRLKLELNQLQQDRAALELELHQKDEVILKTQGEAQKKGNQYLHEIKQLQDKLNTINEHNNNEELKVLRDENAALKERDGQLNEKVKALKDTVDQYETTLSRIVPESEKLKAEHDTAKNHLSTLEMSFADVHTKYERCKDIIVGYKSNEEALKESLEQTNQLARKYEERYETLKAHAKAQLDKANKELAAAKEKHAMEINKFGALIKRLEIKNGSIQQALEQKTKECAALAALCDEISGSVPQ